MLWFFTLSVSTCFELMQLLQFNRRFHLVPRSKAQVYLLILPFQWIVVLIHVTLSINLFDILLYVPASLSLCESLFAETTILSYFLRFYIIFISSCNSSSLSYFLHFIQFSFYYYLRDYCRIYFFWSINAYYPLLLVCVHFFFIGI